MTLIANNEYDRKINPQGMKIGSFSIPSERLTVDVGEENVGNMNDIEGQGEEDAALQEEQALIDENNAEDEGYFGWKMNHWLIMIQMMVGKLTTIQKILVNKVTMYEFMS